MKQCKQCKKIKEESFFEKEKKVKSGIGANCKDCKKEYMNKKSKEYYSKNPNKFTEKSKKWRKDNPEKQKEIKTKAILKIKKEAFSLLGVNPPKCECCGEKEINFLCIDHIKNDGNKERQELKLRGGSDFYRFIRNKYNPALERKYQILCFNCNNGKRINKGICPHKNYEQGY